LGIIPATYASSLDNVADGDFAVAGFAKACDYDTTLVLKIQCGKLLQ
jgi:hypothetical protein